MKKTSHYPTQIHCLPLLVCVVAVAGCGRRQPQDAVRETVKNEVKAAKDRFSGVTTAVMKESQLSGGDEQGRPLWSVGAKEIQVLETKSETEPRRALLTNARATVYRNGKPESTFRAARAELVYGEKSARISLRGDVRAMTSGPWVGPRGPVTIETPRLEVDATKRRLWSNQGVRVAQGKGQQVVVTARQLNADSSIRVARLAGTVKAASAQGAIAADKAVWNWETGRAAAAGHVIASHEGTTVSGAHLEADTDARRGVLSGAVRASASGAQAQAARVRFDWSARTLAAGGGVTLTKDGATLRAASLDTDDKLNHATARGDVQLRKGDVSLRAASVAAFDKMARAEASGGVILRKGDVTLRAARATAFDDMQRAAAEGGVTLTRASDGLTITAARAEASGISKNGASRITAHGNVFARNRAGSVRAANVTWGGGRVVATGGVRLSKDGNVLTGASLQSDDHFRQAVLSGGVRGRLAQGETVAAGTLTWRNGRILARRGVSARRGVLTLRGDRLDATADGNHATVTGNVVVTNDEGATLRAPLVRYDKKTGKVFAAGGVWFSDPRRGMRQHGKTLIANLKLREATMTQVTGSGNMQLFEGKKLF
ncbi:MAG TPA: LPS export ABC transporter periplasmic protein LptC [Abditibacteriaceae bacterium]|nr:LPS export ABC transporter periplasmic protein LptC [Abditibacteriaceae bacterium]